jgi:hypothetical protein
VAREPDALRRRQEEREDEAGRAAGDEDVHRVPLRVLAGRSLPQDVEDVTREEESRGELQNAREERDETAGGVETEGLARVAQQNAGEHQPEARARGASGPDATHPENAREGVIRDSH